MLLVVKSKKSRKNDVKNEKNEEATKESSKKSIPFLDQTSIAYYKRKIMILSVVSPFSHYKNIRRWNSMSLHRVKSIREKREQNQKRR